MRVQLGMGDYVRITLLQEHNDIGPAGAILEGPVVEISAETNSYFAIQISPIDPVHPSARIFFSPNDDGSKIHIERLISVVSDPAKIPF